MSFSSYTASERRGIIIIALVALSIIVAGLIVSFCGRQPRPADEFPVVQELPELVDSTALINSKDKEKSRSSSKKSENSKSASSSKKSKSKSNSQKNRRTRSHRDEEI